MEKCSMDCICYVTWNENYKATELDENGIKNWLSVAKKLVIAMLKEKLKPILDKHFLLHEEKEDTLDYYIPGEKLELKICVYNVSQFNPPKIEEILVQIKYEIYDIESGVKIFGSSNSAEPCTRINVKVKAIDSFHYEYSISGFINYIEKENTLILCYPYNEENNSYQGFMAIENTVNERQILFCAFSQFLIPKTLICYTNDSTQCSTNFEKYSVNMNGKIYMSNIPVIKNECIVDELENLKFIWCDEFNTSGTFYKDSKGAKVYSNGEFYRQIYGPFWIKEE